ncbi:uncharacterized protein LOC131306579 [Rhododendron vialii]|uniref:uncharacterized protein LOC131306579 n=1 Tax=Rhododendron vialii TaxID=182163 RepID=UPI00265F708D|nr:uncharacterized protein LOC131306579 [Rhododendron vialii]
MFDPKPDLPNLHAHTFNPTSRINERWADANIESRVRKTSENYQSYRSHRAAEDDTEDDSGFSSPPLWKTNYKHLSPNSRSQAIARGQWELMEMVKTMPESCYELSLRDIVEHPIRAQSAEDRLVDDEKVLARKPSRGVKREESRVKMVRSRSRENNHGGGLLLKMAFPFSLGSKKKKKNLAGTNSFSRVSPRPEGVDRGGKGGEKEWWKKRFSSESGGGSGSSGGSSSSSSGRKKSGCSLGCWSFLTKRNMKTSK